MIRNQEISGKATVDRIGYLLAWEQANKPLAKELKGLKAELQAQCTNRPAGDAVHLEGNLYYLDLTAREEERVITSKPKAFAALRKALGIVKLIESLSITFKLLTEAKIPVEEQAKWVTSARTGSRDIAGGLIAAPVVAAVAV